jgi:hypothetical protein
LPKKRLKGDKCTAFLISSEILYLFQTHVPEKLTFHATQGDSEADPQGEIRKTMNVLAVFLP